MIVKNAFKVGTLIGSVIAIVVFLIILYFVSVLIYGIVNPLGKDCSGGYVVLAWLAELRGDYVCDKRYGVLKLVKGENCTDPDQCTSAAPYCNKGFCSDEQPKDGCGGYHTLDNGSCYTNINDLINICGDTRRLEPEKGFCAYANEEYCNKDSDCSGGNLCIFHTCKKLHPGDKCTADDQCPTNFHCLDSEDVQTCQFIGVTSSSQEGFICTVANCGSGLTCDKSTGDPSSSPFNQFFVCVQSLGRLADQTCTIGSGPSDTFPCRSDLNCTKINPTDPFGICLFGADWMTGGAGKICPAYYNANPEIGCTNSSEDIFYPLSSVVGTSIYPVRLFSVEFFLGEKLFSQSLSGSSTPLQIKPTQGLYVSSSFFGGPFIRVVTSLLTNHLSPIITYVFPEVSEQIIPVVDPKTQQAYSIDALSMRIIEASFGDAFIIVGIGLNTSSGDIVLFTYIDNLEKGPTSYVTQVTGNDLSKHYFASDIVFTPSGNNLYTADLYIISDVHNVYLYNAVAFSSNGNLVVEISAPTSPIITIPSGATPKIRFLTINSISSSSRTAYVISDLQHIYDGTQSQKKLYDMIPAGAVMYDASISNTTIVSDRVAHNYELINVSYKIGGVSMYGSIYSTSDTEPAVIRYFPVVLSGHHKLCETGVIDFSTG